VSIEFLLKPWQDQMVEERTEPVREDGGAGTPVPASHRVPTHLARRFQQICLGAAAEVIEPAGMTPAEYGLLAAVQDMPGLDQRRLAAALGIDPVSAGQMIDRLEHAGLVARRVDPDDRRARLLSATPSGGALRQRLRLSALAAQERIMASLTLAERAMFLDLLTRVVEANQSYARPGNGRRRPQRKATDANDDHGKKRGPDMERTAQHRGGI